MTLATLLRGKQAEEKATQWLRGKGWKILHRNFRTRGAELDIVALEGQTLVFVEVKQRSTLSAGFPEEAVGPQKIAKLYKGAQFYLKTQPQHAARNCRFDVLALEGDGPQVKIRHTPDVGCL